MGHFPTNETIIGRTMPLIGLVGAPNALPAWVFQNQTGVLGTNLNGSVLYVGVTGDISVILGGTSLNSVSTIGALTSGGTLYTNGITAATTCSNNMAQDLTVGITTNGAPGVIQSLTIVAAGSGYNPGDIITIVEAGRGGGAVDATAVITAVNDGVPVSAQAITFKGVQAGSILPVAIDYVTALTTVAEADIVVGR